ncbi:MAG: copper oxidase [Chloroflexota bacterium]
MRKNRLAATIIALLLPVVVLAGCDLFGSGTPVGTGTSPSAGSTIMAGQTPGVLMPENPAADEAMAAISADGVPDATESMGGQPLTFKMDGGVKVFELTAKPIRWHILGNVAVTAYTYNGMVPGPLIRVTQGDRVRVVLKNDLPAPTTIHWHGMDLPNDMDGVPDMTQKPVQPGETFTYEFVAKNAGTYWYHSHFASDVQIGVGLHGALVVDPAVPDGPAPAVDKVLMLEEWRIIDAKTYPSMPATGMDANYFTINGKAYPDTEEIKVKVGQKVRLRFIGTGQLGHPMHIHGPAFKIVATDGHPVPEAAQLTKDTVWVAPGERYDIEWVATEPGMWMLHCHISHHTTNDHAEPGGLMMVLNVEP